MFDKNDPLIASVKAVMEKNAKERAATNAVNEAFGITSRKALPHERQHEWDTAFKKALTEGVESLEEKSENVEEELKGDQHKIDVNQNNRVDGGDLKALRMKKILSFRKKMK